jgi:UDP-N-acetylmuramate dehydrogenase
VISAMLDRSLFRTELTELLGGRVRFDLTLARLTTMKIGGPVGALIFAEHREECHQVVTFLEKNRTPWRLIGRGSNVLAPDEGFDGALLALGDGFKTIEKSTDLSEGKVLVRAGAGLSLTRVADWCAARGLAGLEFAAGIPGCVGAAVLKNAGAWGSEMGAVVASVTVMSGREERTLPRSCLHFSYRSLRMAPVLPAPLIVAAVEFELRRSSTVAIREQMAYYHQLRREKQPLNQPSAGSFFKNPPALFAAELIESAGLKGLRVGDAQVSTRHANFFVNRGRATARQMIALMREVQQKVEKQHGVRLEPEVEVW